MTRLRCRAAATMVVALAAWLSGTGVASAAACAPPDRIGSAERAGKPPAGFVIVEEPQGPGAAAAPLTRLAPSEAQRRALLEPELRDALRLRPGSNVRVRYLADGGRWRVSVRPPGSAKTLASIELSDVTGCVVRRSAIPLGDYPPRNTERQVIDAAVADKRVRRIARRWGGVDRLRARAAIDGCCWEVDLLAPHRRDGDPDAPVIRADVVDSSRSVTGVWTGIKVSWKMARGDRDAFGGDVNEPVIWYSLFVLFALVAIDWGRLRSWFNADVLAVLAIGASHEAFLQGAIDWSVPLAIPPLLWLAVRMGWVFVRGMPPPRQPAARGTGLRSLVARRVPTTMIVVFCVALAGLRIGLTLDGGNVIDVGYAGVAGARLELQGEAPWENMPDDNVRGDTYGPANYLAYVPATALIDDPERDRWGGSLPAAQATSIAADLGCALVLAIIGWRWISRRGGALLAAGWLACPWTTWALASGVNDALLALALLIAFAVLPWPVLRGAAIGVAAMIKFAPLAVLAPMLHAGASGRRRQTVAAIGGCTAVVAAGLAWAVWRIGGSPLDALQTFAERTVLFQVGRDSPFSPWGLYGWDAAQRVAQIAVVALIGAACLVPRVRDAWQTAAGAAAVLIALQLVTTHWFYLYVPWFMGFVLIVLVAARERPAPEAP